MEVKALYEKRGDYLSKIDQLKDTLTKENRGFTPQEDSEFSKLSAELTLINNKIRQIEFENGVTNEAPSVYGPTYSKTKGLESAKAFKKALQDLHKGKVAKLDETHIRAVTTATSSGGYAIESPVSSDIFLESLADDAILSLMDLQIGISNNLIIPKIERGNGPTVVGQATQESQISDSSLQITKNQFDLKNRFCLVRVHRDLLEDGVPGTENALLTEISRQVRNDLLQNCFYGTTSTSGQFNGLDNYTGLLTADAGSSTLSNYSKIIEAVRKLMAKNVPLNQIAAVMHPAIWEQITNFQGTDNHYMMPPANIANLQMLTTSAIKTDYGTGTDESRIYIGDFSACKVGIRGAYEFKLEERYADYYQVGFLVAIRADLQLYDEERMCIIQNIATA